MSAANGGTSSGESGMFGNFFVCCGRRDVETIPKGQYSPSTMCGVGINFRADKTGALCVSSLIPGGPASRTGSVMVGDILYDVDEKLVYRTALSNVSQHLLGPADTTVNVGFLRGGYRISVDIKRAPFGNPAA
mmetsp:Transcript_27323/g.55839  ORF Transcript_27323/g.55839 Transcript_27323/m.55839 type:complete len:133 (+) Transcript_27323:209-607(+)